VTGRLREHVNAVQRNLLVAVAVCYGIGYPVAVVGGSSMGWALVTLGGLPLIALGVVTVRRIHRESSGDLNSRQQSER
jgi:hypothetical protein